MKSKKIIEPGKWYTEFDENGNCTKAVYDDSYLKLLGYETKEASADAWEGWTSRLHPDDAARVGAYSAEIIKKHPEGMDYDIEYRLMTKWGYRWFHDYGICTRREDGSIARCDGVAFDIQDTVDKDANYGQSVSIANYFLNACTTAYYCDFTDGSVKILQDKSAYAKTMGSRGINYTDSVINYVNKCVHPDDRKNMLEKLNAEYARKVLAEEESYTFDYRDIMEVGAGTYRGIVMRGEDSDHVMVIFLNVTEEFKKEQLQIETEHLRSELINRMSGADAVFLIDLVNDTRRTIKNKTQGASYYSDKEKYSEAFSRYIDNYVAESDREMMRRVSSPEYIMEQLKDKSEYYVRYRDILTGVQNFYEMKVAKFSDTEILQSFKEDDKDIVDLLVFNKLEDDYFALFVADLDAGIIRVTKNASRLLVKEGTTSEYTPLLKDLASKFEGETRDFFERISDINYIRKKFKDEDKNTYTYKDYQGSDPRWVNATGLVLARQEDGTPSLFTLGFITLDAYASEKEELQLKIRESMNVVGGLASEYTALYHVSLDSGKYTSYHLTSQTEDIKDYFENCPRFVDLAQAFAGSRLVDPAYSQALRDFYPSDEDVRKALKDKKKLSMLFKRNYGGEYLWTEAVIVKCEDTREDAHNIVVGFAEKDAEIKRQQEEQKLRRDAENSKKFLDSFASSFDIVYIVNMNDDSLETIKLSDIDPQKESGFRTFTEVNEYILSSVIHPRDRKRMQKELCFASIRNNLAKDPSYSVEYSIIKNNVTCYREMTVTALGEDRFVIGIADREEEIVRRRLASLRYEEYIALFVVDIDTAMIKAAKTSSLFKTAEAGAAVPYSYGLKLFAEAHDGETRDFFTELADIEFVKREFAAEDKRTFSYKSSKLAADKWMNVVGYVIQRHEDGSPAVFTLGFSQPDSKSTQRQELQAQRNEDMQMISGLASGYETLYYINIDEGTFKIYSLDGQRFPEAKKFAISGGDPFAILRRYGDSGLIHPDDRHLFDDLNAKTYREKLAHRKKISIRFRRDFGGEYLWSEMDVIKFEGIDEPANVIAVGFAERDAEIQSEQALNSCFNVLGKEIPPVQAINELLSIIGDFYAAERAYIFEFGENRAVINNTFEWCSEGVEPMISNLQNIPSMEVEGWMQEFRTNGAFCLGSLDDSGAYGSEEGRTLLEMQGIESLIAAPIMNGNEIVGFIGVDNPAKAKTNTNVLKSISVVAYSEILKRKENDEEHVTLDKLTETFMSVYYADLSRDYMHNWKIDADYKDAYGAVEYYSVSMGGYVQNNIAERDRKRCIMMTSPEYVLEQFRTKDRFSIDMTDIMLGYERSFVFDYIKVNEEGTHLVICCRDVTDSLAKEKAQQKQLQDALDAADTANKSKTSFLFNMSHDIRTPMNAITGFTNMAIKHIDDREKTLDCLSKIQQSGNMLLSLINSVLEVSRIESGNAQVDEQPGDVYFSFTNIETTMLELAEVKNIDLSFEFGQIMNRYVFCDFSRCMRVFVNVISNAIKYTPNGGYVKVRCEQTGEPVCGYANYCYTVEDNGIGMSEEFQKHVFEQFSREKTSTVSGIQGTGLGMAVCKSFVELMGGTIECRSKQGEGTTFIINLPFRLQDSAKYTDPVTGDVVGAFEQGVEPEKIDFTGKRVLLVEDNELNREIAVDILSDEGIIVEEAGDGTEAVQCFKENGPGYYDFVLMDIQMPVMGGYEATAEIRKMYPDCYVPIIALSANAFAEDKAESIAAGMDDHVAKPINIKELFRALARFM